ncbi:tetratricopeptide repeat protein [Lachnospiraceae bacterium 48-21]
MSKINTAGLKHFSRMEEDDILNYVSNHNETGHISVFGLSGTGKTEIITSSINLLHEGDKFSDYTILHYDAFQIMEDCTKDLFYNLLIYKLLQKTNPNSINKTYVTEHNTFLAFLEKGTYKEEIKNNAKKALIASLSLLPTVGPLIYKLLNTNEDNSTKDYHTNQYLFNEYLNYLCMTTGLIVFIDNIQYIPKKILDEFYELFRQLEGRMFLFTSYTLKADMSITKKLIEKHILDNNTLVLHIENISLEIFEEICKQNLTSKQYYNVKRRLEYLYALVQYGNMREIDELIFQINQNGTEYINETPTLQGIKALDEIKKDIIDLAALFPEGIKLSFIEKIVKYNHGCTEAQLHQSISNLCKMKYILIGENDTLKIEHEKISQASKQNLEFAEEEERFIDLVHSCEKVFTDILYEPIDDSDFVFCVNGLMEFEKQFNFLKHLGVLEKYINILYTKFRYFQICQLYRNLSHNIKDGDKMALLFPICSIIQILDSFQKTSCFDEGLEISNQLSNFYNMELYKAKFLLQSYHYQDAIAVLENRLNSYESWSIYLNALQHLRRDNDVRDKITYLLNNPFQYSDIEYYYIILRNSGHLFGFDKAIDNLQQALEYFQNLSNKFVESTCLNNIGILYLYQGQNKENINTARNKFTQAKKIMHQIKSNEEYQSIINIGVSYICENNPRLALEYFECALTIMPSNLTFDIIKLKCNILICKYLIDNQELINIREELLDLCTQAEDLPDPWIKLLCIYNLYVLRKDNISNLSIVQKDYPGDINLYGLIIKIDNKDRFMLGISPHWRY